MSGNVESELLKYVCTECLSGEDWGQLTRDDELVDSGILDSQGILKLVAHLERTYGIAVESDEIVPQNFGTVALIDQFVARKRGA